MSNDKSLDQQVAERLSQTFIERDEFGGESPYYVVDDATMKWLNSIELHRGEWEGFWTQSLDRAAALWDTFSIVASSNGLDLFMTYRKFVAITLVLKDGVYSIQQIAEKSVERWLEVTALIST